MQIDSKDARGTMTPAKALAWLRDGNQRFMNNLQLSRDLRRQASETKSGERPFAVVLSCVDSRISAELIFDQGLGDIVSVRIFGNVLNDDVLGSLELACAVSGATLILVLGHTGCTALRSACRGLRLGHFNEIIDKVQPSIDSVRAEEPGLSEAELVAQAAHDNARRQMYEILDRSPLLHGLYAEGRIGLAAGLYSVASGIVSFFDALLDEEDVSTCYEPQSA